MSTKKEVWNSPDEVRRIVRQGYGRLASKATGCCGPPAPTVEQPQGCCGPPAPTVEQPQGCCGPPAPTVEQPQGCCGPPAATVAASGPLSESIPAAGKAQKPTPCCGPATTPTEHSKRIGYKAEELDGIPDEAVMGLGCGNPTALADLKPGEVVVDLGAGAGIDAFIAAKKVGPAGRVIGVDMTPEMLERARENAVKAGLTRTVEFREGIIEALPVVSESADVVISNCVINLSPDKPQVFREAFRVLKPGGRLAVSDIVLTKPLPEEILQLADAYVGCIAGAITADAYLGAIRDAGFVDVETSRVSARAVFESALEDPIIQQAVERLGEDQIQEVIDSIWSYRIEARKP